MSATPAERILLELTEVKTAGNCVCGTLDKGDKCYLCERIKFWTRRVLRGRALLLKDGK